MVAAVQGIGVYVDRASKNEKETVRVVEEV
jgi:hypothetical protein